MNQGIAWRSVEGAFKSLIKEATGLECVWGNSNGVQPDRTYAMLTWLTFDNIGDSGVQEIYEDNKVLQNYYSSRTASVDVQVFAESTRAGENAIAYLDAIMVALDLTGAAKKWLDPVDVAISNFTPAARLLDAVEDGGRIVSRAAFTMKLNMAANVASAETPSTIDTVALTGSVTGSGALTGGLTVTRL